MLALQGGEFVLGGRPVRECDSGRHGGMAAHGDPRGQGAHRSVRRTVDRVGERFDERSRRPFARAGRLKQRVGTAVNQKLILIYLSVNATVKSVTAKRSVPG
ncbi:hypothetical protein ACR6C2_05685 [Streptomyces sp. INA 01156]